MFFHIIGIKQISGKNYNLEFIAQNDSENLLREYLSKIGIVILSIEKYNGKIEDFGKTKIIIENSEKQENFIIVPSTDYRKVYLLTSLVGVKVSRIESLDPGNDIDQEKMKDNMAEWNTQLEALSKINHSKEKQTQAHDFDIQDHKITEMQLLSSQVIQRSKVIQKTLSDEMDMREKKKLIELTQELAKIKLGTNIEKMKIYANDIIEIINKVEKRQISKLTQFQQSIFQGSAVTNIDVAKEVQKYEKAEDIKKIGGEQSTNDKFYSSLGKVGLYLKFIWKDFLHKISKVDMLVYAIFTFLQQVLFFTIVLIAFYLILRYKMYDGIVNDSVAGILIKISIFSFLLLIVEWLTKKYFAKKRYVYIIIGILITLPLYFICISIVKNTLSL